MALAMSACRELSTWLQRNPTTSHHRSFGSYQGTISYSWIGTCECGCMFCDIIRRVVKEKADEISPMMQMNYTSNGLVVCVNSIQSTQIFVLEPHPLHMIPVSTPMPGDTSSEQSFQTILRWLTNCIKTHERCSRGLSAGLLPDRVLDLNYSTTGDVRLIETTHERGTYACLSHCWGPPEHRPPSSTTDPDTFSEYKANISFSKMPKVFQEAIIVTRKLGIPYLWIDSLCIIQDSITDWQVQSSKMAHIYSNAILTLAATSASHSGESLFSSDHPWDVPYKPSVLNVNPMEISFKIPALDIPPWYIPWNIPYNENSNAVGHPCNWSTSSSASTGCAEHEKIFCLDREIFADHLSTLFYFPLLQRAWAFQERILSPRFLHFGKHELVWECEEGFDCECSKFSQRPITSDTKFHWPLPKMHLNEACSRGIPRDGPILDRGWWGLVSQYSKLQLSVESDMLPAISGVAHVIRKLTKRTYLAGIWKESLAWDLCWSNNLGDSRRPSCWRAPTFSWASIVAPDHGIHYPNLDTFLTDDSVVQQHFTLIEAKCVLAGTDETGQVSDGHLILCGTLYPALLVRQERKIRESRMHFWDICELDEESSSESRISKAVELEGSHFVADYDYEVEGWCRVDSGNEVYCVKVISTSKWNEQENSEDRDAYYLVLKEVKNDQFPEHDTVTRGEGIRIFERIGLLWDLNGRESISRVNALENATFKLI